MDALYSEYQKRKEEIKQRLQEFSSVSREDYFYELCFCILTPQSKGKRCGTVAQQLKDLDFFHRDIDLLPLLRSSTRFHHTKARHLLSMKARYPSILEKLSTCDNPPLLREWLVTHVKGIGMKEASHFLRNIGYRGLAILDRHILRSLVRFHVLESLPKTLTPKVYAGIEKSFARFSASVRIPLDELDLLFWSMQTGEVFK